MKPVYPGRIYERICPICGKEFSIKKACGWAYTKGEERFCTWKCMRQYELIRKKPNENKELIREMYHNGVRNQEIAKKLFISIQSVKYWIQKIKDEETNV